MTGVTAWPSALTVAMTWDPQAAYEFGQGMAVEQRTKGEADGAPAMTIIRRDACA